MDNSEKRAKELAAILDKVREMQDAKECGRIEAHFFMGGLSTIHKLTTYKPSSESGNSK